MGFVRGICGHRVLLGLSIATLLGCSCLLITLGSLLFLDSSQVLISVLLTETNGTESSLPKPLFFYVAIGLCSAGLVGVVASLSGCWALVETNYCTLTLVITVNTNLFNRIMHE